MSGDSGASFLVLLLFLLFSLLAGKKPKKRESPASQREPLVPPPSSAPTHRKVEPIQKKDVLEKKDQKPSYTKRTSSSYEVERRQTSSVLPKGWNSKSSLQKAFVLSEILKRVDEE